MNAASMRRRLDERLAWTLVAPLLALATLAGHQAGYRVAVPGASARAEALAHDGHGYFAYLPLVTGAFVALAVVGLAVRARGGGRSTLPLWLAAALPPAGFVAQETLERLVGAHHAGAGAMLGEPAFLVGLALQLPFALLALLLARRLQRFADTLALGRRRRSWPAVAEQRCADEVFLPRSRPLALARSVRGPPRRSF
ncbi:MAG: hypothetical protein ACXW08_07970 [Solirubrobacteraceae bacterium]